MIVLDYGKFGSAAISAALDHIEGDMRRVVAY